MDAYDPSFRTRVLDLMELVQGHRTAEDEFVWEFERNPVGELNIFLALTGEEVIGVSCHNAFRLRVAEHTHACSFPLNVLTHPHHRGKGIFTTLEAHNEDRAAELGFPFMLSFPNDASTKIFLGRLGWTRLSPPVLIGRARIGLHRTRNPVRLEPIEGFDERVDDLGSPQEPAGLVFDRNHVYLNWRFVDRPSGVYAPSLVHLGEEVIGYVVSGVAVKRGIPVAFIAALGMRDGTQAFNPRVRAAALRDSRLPHARVELDLAAAGRGIGREFASGFVPLPKRLNAIYKPLRSGLDLVPTKPRWGIQLGDLDFF